jgi:hypothetical protein
VVAALFIAVSPAGSESAQPNFTELTGIVAELAREQAVTSGNLEALRVELERTTEAMNSLSTNIGDLARAVRERDRR